jgi:predicted membrane protein
MKRLVVLLAVMAILMLALAVPSFAMASDDANCVGREASVFTQVTHGPWRAAPKP